jgi:hypothetical protein
VNWVQNVSAKQFGADPSFGGQAVQVVQNDLGLIVMSIGIDSVDARGNHTEVLVRILADSMYSEDLKNPGVKITK